MQYRTMAILTGIILVGYLVGLSRAQEPVTPARMKADIEAMKVSDVAWRKIDWQPCLLEGLRQAQAEGKPALLWVFIDRPADDARC